MDAQVEASWAGILLTLAQHGYFKRFFGLVGACCAHQNVSSEVHSPTLLALRCLHVFFGTIDANILRVCHDAVCDELTLRCFLEESEDMNFQFITSFSSVLDVSEADWLMRQFQLIPLVNTFSSLHRLSNIFLSKVFSFIFLFF
jgi:hypothetical protein